MSSHPTEDGASFLHDLVKQSKLKLGYVKAKLAKKRLEINELMKDEDNVSIVASQFKSLGVITQDFKVTQQRYHELLKDEADLQTSHDHYQSVMQEINNLFDEASQWCDLASRLQEVDNILANTNSSSTLVKQQFNVSRKSYRDNPNSKIVGIELKLLQRRPNYWQRKLP